MSKSIDNVLLVPGESGWEIWTGQSATGFTLQNATGIDRASDLGSLPNGEVILLFPVKSITAVPMRVTSDDEALFADLAALHAERLGLRPDPMAGQLTDVFTISREAENTALVSVLLRAPGDGDLPARGPKGFEISARVYPLPGDALAVWKELGRWVFALFHKGNLAYCQATSVSSRDPDDSLVREIRLALMQLTMQGIEIVPTRVVLWTGVENPEITSLSAAFRAPVEVSPRPAPILPESPSKLLPADVRASRRAARQRQNIIFGAAAVALIYLGLIGWFGYGLWKDSSEGKKLRLLAEASAPERVEYQTHVTKWDELSDAIELEKGPVHLLSRIQRCIPPGSLLRLRNADITAEEIKLIGEAPQLQSTNSFSLALTKSNDLARFEWQTPPSSQSTRGWEFVFSAATPQNQP